MRNLRHQWEQVCSRLEIGSDGYYEILDDLYRGRLRFYHNWDHIRVVLDRIDALAPVTSLDEHERALVDFAAFYHDAIYVPGFADSERMSGELALAHLETSPHKIGMAKVYRWILATQNHKPAENDQGAQLLCDADLYGLATREYGINGINVRREFGGFSDHDWRRGREQFLKSYLEHNPLFHLPTQGWVEMLARTHMQDELRTLMGDGAAAAS